MNWLLHEWVLVVTFMTALSLCLVTGVIIVLQYYLMGTEEKIYLKFYKNIYLLENISNHTFFQLGLCID